MMEKITTYSKNDIIFSMSLDRRDFIKYGFLSAIFSVYGCGGDSKYNNNSNVVSDYNKALIPSGWISNRKSIKFGLGDDPEMMIDAYDPAGKMVLDALKPDIVCMWINGAVDSSGNPYSPSMDYVRNWANEGRFEEWSNLGYELMIITWENYDGQNPALGPPTYGNYHISSQFISDMVELSSYLKGKFEGGLYFALATEQSTYTACRYDQTCQNRAQYSDVIDSTTIEYFSQLQSNIIKAISNISSILPYSYQGMSFGGWLVEFQQGVDFIKYFEPTIQTGNAIFFQSMMDNTMQENNGYGNPQRIMKNCEFFSSYNKPIHLAHYMPDNQRTDVIASDMSYMANQVYILNLSKYLTSFNFMRYSVLKDNQFNCLTDTQLFRNNLKGI